jgi:hypothetical protein
VRLLRSEFDLMNGEMDSISDLILIQWLSGGVEEDERGSERSCF